MSGPLPPSDLHGRRPDLIVIPAGEELHRFYTASWEPIFFDNSTTGRFNAPDASYGVLYTAKQAAGAFAETFLRPPGRTLIDTDLLRRKGYVRLKATKDMMLIRIAGPGLARLGATAEVVHSGLPYDIPQAWSALLFGHPVGADGIAYHARHDDTELCYALFDRSANAIEEMERNADLDQDWFWRIAERYGVGAGPVSKLCKKQDSINRLVTTKTRRLASNATSPQLYAGTHLHHVEPRGPVRRAHRPAARGFWR